ncbi:hypothetical protein V5P93_003547 [Actinokineospora auranticolor]|uniref:Uncharacterized protein n=1 Tax=Actinokineospora auranticolor TaxID=155976 RepID=A0A2S6GPW3_9PSEU|nr:hypothetical protein [Actinokineospora auranticolor]PPK67210.1 hypothetical protein CLV40_108208 [Actinokineospora auranticolor]
MGTIVGVPSGWYLGVAWGWLLVTAGSAALLRWWWPRAVGRGKVDLDDLSGYEVARLVGGRDRMELMNVVWQVDNKVSKRGKATQTTSDRPNPLGGTVPGVVLGDKPDGDYSVSPKTTRAVEESLVRRGIWRTEEQLARAGRAHWPIPVAILAALVAIVDTFVTGTHHLGAYWLLGVGSVSWGAVWLWYRDLPATRTRIPEYVMDRIRHFTPMRTKGYPLRHNDLLSVAVYGLEAWTDKRRRTEAAEIWAAVVRVKEAQAAQQRARERQLKRARALERERKRERERRRERERERAAAARSRSDPPGLGGACGGGCGGCGGGI